MIFNEDRQKVISNLGWVDKGRLWIYDGIKAENHIVKLSDSQYLTLIQGSDGHFSVIHHYNSSKIEISVHHFNDPQKEYCRTSFDNFKTSFTGDISSWKFVPKYYVGGLSLNTEFNFHLFKVENGIITLEDNKIDWYINGAFDFGYQGLTGVIELNNELIFTVQRDGSLYRYSLDQDKIIDKVNLAGKHGNPQPIIKNDEIWVSDYDTILRLKDWKIKNIKKLQDAAEGTSQFIGSFSFNTEKNICIVARPFSGDVIGLSDDFNIKYKCKLGSQPLEAVLMYNQIVIARDWQTGDLVKGQIKKKWF